MSDDRFRVSRRDVLRGAGVAAFLGAVQPSAAHAQENPAAEGPARVEPKGAKVAFTLNGKRTELVLEPRVTLLDAIRDRAGLTGAKRVCDRGACGACTVFVDGRTVNACMMLAHDAQGAAITTIEGIEKDGELHPVQEAFIRHDALQCGFCTPGMVMSCVAFLEGGGAATDENVRAAVAGNLCRCGTYPHVFSACKEAADGR